jgi:hypothetical protein
MWVMSAAIAQAQRGQIARGIETVLAAQGSLPRRLLISGAGSFLAEQTIAEIGALDGAETVRLADQFGSEIAEAACAFALARLAVERGELLSQLGCG